MRFGQNLKKRKNGFSIVFSKYDLAGRDKFFHQILFLKNPNTSECGQVLVVSWVKLDCVKALLSPDPNTEQEPTLICIYFLLTSHYNFIYYFTTTKIQCIKASPRIALRCQICRLSGIQRYKKIENWNKLWHCQFYQWLAILKTQYRQQNST